MKSVITALGTTELNDKLKERGEFEVIGNDIPYQEGLLDIIKANSQIDILILSEVLFGEYDIKEFLNLILKINSCIEIILFLECENLSLKNYLNGIGITKVYIDNQKTLDEILDEICNNAEQNLTLEIEKLKKLIESNKLEKNSNTFESTNPKVIAVTGTYGSGKSLVTSLLGMACKKRNMHAIIIDFDIFNNSINTMYKINRNYKIIENINQCIKKIDKNIDVFFGMDRLFNENNKISFEKIKELFEELKNKYDRILIDTSSEINLKYIKVILSNVDKILFLVEPNLIEIKKAKNLLEVYLEDWKISEYKFKIVINKANYNSIDNEIVKNIFPSISIIEKINYSNSYTSYANNIFFNNINLSKYINILKKL